MQQPTIISMKDIRLSLAAIARRVEAGERFIVVRDSKPVFRISPLVETYLAADQSQLTFSFFKIKIDSVREPGDIEWTPAAVEEVIQEMYRERNQSAEKPSPPLKRKKK